MNNILKSTLILVLVAFVASFALSHVDKITKPEIKKQEELASNEKICYLGNGSFGIITFRNPSSPIKFLIRKRIQYENTEETPLWRKKLPVKLHKKNSR